jgi:hypothetical protein
LSKRQEVVFKELADQGFPVTVIRSIDDVEEFICESLRSACVSETPSRFGAIGAELGSVSTPWTWKDDDIVDDTGGSV